MPRSSETIGTLAAALAKAQCELVNPEKSLTATIRSDAPGARGEQSFNYAPLSSGLEIVRKTLGHHEIAVAQTTAIDQASGIVNLTTVLAHSSGEWIASDWPVCPVSDIATPHRMGKALTYARRYALFTLVGIAGEDDLDAPDVVTPTDRSSSPERAKTGNRSGNGSRKHGHAKGNDAAKNRASEPPLTPEASAHLCDQLVGEIDELKTGDEAARWAKRQLAVKNRLTGADARRVETAFQAKLASLPTVTEDSTPARTPARATSNGRARRGTKSRGRSETIDKSALTFPEPRRIRDRDHLRFVTKQPCLVCGRQPADAHHLRFAQSPALGRKVSDEFTVPLCRGHHREVHRCGNETVFWQRLNVDPLAAARALWIASHPRLALQDDRAVVFADPDHVEQPDMPAVAPQSPI